MYSAENMLAFISGVICILSVTAIVIKIKTRMPLNFAVNLCLYTLAIMSRAINALVFNNTIDNPIRIIISGVCVGLVELSL